MSIDLSVIKKEKNLKPPRIVIYGPPGVGKSTFCSKADDVLFMDVEDGLGTIECSKYGVKYYDVAMELLRALYNNEHSFKTLVIDSADWIEKLINEKVCSEHKVDGIESFGYGKGYSYATEKFREFLNSIEHVRNKCNMTIIFTAHCDIKRYDNPTTDSYDRYALKLHKSNASILTEWCDALLFANQKIFTKKESVGFNNKTKAIGGERVLHTTEKPGFIAKNRYSLPDEITLSWDDFIKNINNSLGE